MGVFIQPKQYVLGLSRIDQVETGTKKSSELRRNNKDDVDCTRYSLLKYIKLCIENNPNIIEMLYFNDSDRIKVDSYGQRLIDNRHLFLSKKAFHTFRGYAYSQKHKLETKAENDTGRRELIHLHGWNTKAGSHWARLMIEARDIFLYNELRFPLKEAEFLKDIKKGLYTLEYITKFTEELGKEIDCLYEKSQLQYSANIKEIERMQIEMLEEYWKSGINYKLKQAIEETLETSKENFFCADCGSEKILKR
jgi:predicted nucleotidyltransferase